MRRSTGVAAVWRLGWTVRGLLATALLGLRYAWTLRLCCALRMGRALVVLIRSGGYASRERLSEVSPKTASSLPEAASRLPSLQNEPVWHDAVPSAASSGLILQDSRVRRLQEKALRMLCSRYLGITMGRADAAVLSRYASSTWVLGNIYTAAGIGLNGAASYQARGPRPTVQDCQRRCTVVFPVVVRLLDMAGTAHPGVVASKRVAATARLRLLLARRRYRVGPHGEITASLYPEAVDVEWYRHRAELVGAHARRDRKAASLRAELRALSVYDMAVSFLLQPPPRAGWHTQNRYRRLLQRLEHIHGSNSSIISRGLGGQDGQLEREGRGVA